MDSSENLILGDIVSGLDPRELVEIQRVAPFGNKVLVEGVGVQSRRVIKRPFTVDELNQGLGQAFESESCMCSQG